MSETIQVATYMQDDDPVYLAVKEEAESKAVSRARVVNWALQDWYKAKLAEQQRRQVELGTIAP